MCQAIIYLVETFIMADPCRWFNTCHWKYPCTFTYLFILTSIVIHSKYPNYFTLYRVYKHSQPTVKPCTWMQFRRDYVQDITLLSLRGCPWMLVCKTLHQSKQIFDVISFQLLTKSDLNFSICHLFTHTHRSGLLMLLNHDTLHLIIVLHHHFNFNIGLWLVWLFCYNISLFPLRYHSQPPSAPTLLQNRFSRRIEVSALWILGIAVSCHLLSFIVIYCNEQIKEQILQKSITEDKV